MSDIQDSKLHSSFCALFSAVLKILKNGINSETKELLSDLPYSALFKIYRKHLEAIKQSSEFKKFESIIQEHNKYAENFTENVKYGWKWGKTLENFLEGFFVEYIKSHGLESEIDLPNYYSQIENFLFNNKIKMVITTPIIGLKTSNTVIRVNSEVCINQLAGQRKIPYYDSTEIVNYAFAFHDLVYEFYIDKEQLGDDYHKIWQSKRALIRDFLIVLRLFKSGKIGFLDSNLLYTIFHGGQTWKNFDCDIGEEWHEWEKKPYVLTIADIENVNQLWKDIHKIDFRDESNKFLSIAIDRFMTSYEKDSPHEKILDLIISLEALLQDTPAELSYRLSIRTAVLLEEENSKRNKIFKIIRQGYDARNKIAHGNEVDDVKIDGQTVKLQDLVEQIEECVRRSIKKIGTKISQGQTKKWIIAELENALFQS